MCCGRLAGTGPPHSGGQGKTRVIHRLTKFQKILNGAKPYGANGGEQLKKGQKNPPPGEPSHRWARESGSVNFLSLENKVYCKLS